MIAWEGRIVRLGYEEVGIGSMCRIRARPRPEIGDQLGDAKRQQRAEAGRNDAVTPVERAPLAAFSALKSVKSMRGRLATVPVRAWLDTPPGCGRYSP